MLKKLIGHLQEEQGVALITVMGIIMLITIMIIGIVYYSEGALKSAVNIQNNTTAYQLANSGIDAALADVSINGFKTENYPKAGAIVGGTYNVTAVYVGNSQYKVESIGTATTGETQKIVVMFFYMNLWNMNLAAGQQQSMGGGTLHGNAGVTGPFYVKGNVVLGGNSVIEGGPLFVKGGDLTLTGSGVLGAVTPIDVYVTGAYPVNGSKGMNASSISQSVPSLTLPILDNNYLTEMYIKAKAQSVDNFIGGSAVANHESVGNDPLTYTTINPPNSGWTRPKAPGASSYYKIVGNDAAPSTINNGHSDLTLDAISFGSWYGDGHTMTAGETDDFAYDAVNGRLYVNGTVYVDGDLTINRNIKYVGNGNMICNGTVEIHGNFLPDTADQKANSGHIVGLIGTADFNLHQVSIAGAFFCQGDFHMTQTNTLVRGSVLAGSISFDQPNEILITDPNLPSYLPESMPGKGMGILSKGLWTRP